jgi:hypothetical protein
MNLSRSLFAASAVFAAAASLQAQSFLIDFDSVSDGASANLAAPSGVSFGIGTFSPNLDSEGDVIPGTSRWQVDVSAGSPVVRNPSFYDRGAAPSAPNALDAVFETVLVRFGSTMSLSSFSVALDNDTFGTDGTAIEFYSVGATVNTLLASISIDQSIPGLIASLSTPISGVDLVVLPSGAMYDSLSFTAVPEPSEWAVAAAGMMGVVAWMRSRRA